MAIILKLASEGREFIIAPPGNHLARLFSIIDLGTQLTEWEGKEKPQHKLLFRFELHGKDNDGNYMITETGEPLTINKKYTKSFFETATLRQHLEAWRGRSFTEVELEGFDLVKVLDNFCMLTITQDTNKSGKRYAQIKNVSSVPYEIKERGFPKGHNPKSIFSLDNMDHGMFEKLPQWIKDQIMLSPEYKMAMGYVPDVPADPFGNLDDDVPF
jgi:hypothetical protein